jgi:hypothetical protein
MSNFDVEALLETTSMVGPSSPASRRPRTDNQFQRFLNSPQDIEDLRHLPGTSPLILLACLFSRIQLVFDPSSQILSQTFAACSYIPTPRTSPVYPHLTSGGRACAFACRSSSGAARKRDAVVPSCDDVRGDCRDNRGDYRGLCI